MSIFYYFFKCFVASFYGLYSHYTLQCFSMITSIIMIAHTYYVFFSPCIFIEDYSLLLCLLHRWRWQTRINSRFLMFLTSSNRLILSRNIPESLAISDNFSDFLLSPRVDPFAQHVCVDHLWLGLRSGCSICFLSSQQFFSTRRIETNISKRLWQTSDSILRPLELFRHSSGIKKLMC